jgi:N-acetylated-alpha-linked acidic dipeptidase
MQRHCFRPLTILGLSCLIAFSAAAGTSNGAILGFSEQGATQQRTLETQYDALMNRDNLSQWMKRMTANPQHLGSPYGKENAEFMLSLFREWGFDAEIETFYVLFPTPKVRVVELVEPHRFTAKLQEPVLEEDATSMVRDNALPGYNAYSADGDVTAELVYVNQGIPRDYEELERMGIDVTGKIVLARYGGSWRGTKPKVAAEHGAIGCIIYSDPRDDGYFRGDVYPEGPFRAEHGVQRGSVLDMPLYPGDPLTPGVGATKNAKRIAREVAPTLMKIPVHPISYADALPLLKALGGPVAPESWRGALPLTYHVGPGPAKVHLKLEFNWDLTPVHNVIARMRGSEFPDEWIIRGNHRDGWVFGAEDPTSGTVALMEEARAIGELAKTGWRPKRTIVYASWDGEEAGLLGSTEWVETHADELREKAAIYINTDSNGRGFLGFGGSHTLEKSVNEVAREVEDPQTGVSVAERARARLRIGGDKEADTRADLRIAPLGSGGDFTPFLQHLGIATLHVLFYGENLGGVYHSTFDSYDYYTRFDDPTFDYGIALAKTAGRITLRFASADVLPYAFTNFADNVAKYVREVTALADEMREETERHNDLVAANVFSLAADPTKRYIPPQAKAPVPYLNFAPLRNTLAMLEASAKAYDAALREHGTMLDASSRETLNDILRHVEQAMMRAEGVPGRPWFQHYIYAPGYYTGYGVKTLPGVREAIERRDWVAATKQVGITSDVLENVAAEIERATAVLKEK